ncbi:MAG: acetyl-CoA carboxylase biotin carboxyl carrier protein subunit [Bacteroidota bacterium]
MTTNKKEEYKEESQEKTNPQQVGGKENEKPAIRYSSFWIDATKYKTKITDKFKNRKKWDSSNRGAVYSEFPGTVLKVDVKKGDNVEKGDRLYIYDAMKMKNRAYSPRDGKVKEVKISEDEVIKKGQLLFVIE